jgi:hypothetical protein
MKQLTIVLSAVLLTLSFATTANAGLGIGARYSYVHNNDLEDNSSMVGAMVRLRHMMFCGIEGAIDSRNEELNDGSELRSTPITASVMVFPIPVVYGLAGLGLYRSTLEVAGEEETDTQLGYHFGAGVEAPLIPLLKLTGDIRYQFVDYEFDEIAESLGKVEANGYAISAGLILYLK